MTLESFVERERAAHEELLERFKHDWSEGAKVNPRDYPLDLPESEWSEEFYVFTKLCEGL
jgi:hypothetical protein